MPTSPKISGQPESGLSTAMVASASQRDHFARHIESHLDSLYAAAVRLTRNVHDAQDLVAETVTRAWTGIETLHDASRLLPWMLRIMTNQFISERRKRIYRTPHEEYIEEPAGDDAPFSIFERLHQPILLWWGNPEQQFLDQLLKEDIEAALDALPESFRIVVVLADLEGLSYQEIAEALELQRNRSTAIQKSYEPLCFRMAQFKTCSQAVY